LDSWAFSFIKSYFAKVKVLFMRLLHYMLLISAFLLIRIVKGFNIREINNIYRIDKETL
jgi:hypothetical protein